MVHSAKESATYNDLLDVPENMIGEIVDGKLVVTPRPAPGHMKVVTILSEVLGPPYRGGRGGPGGWIFLFETEIRSAISYPALQPERPRCAGPQAG